MASNAIAGTASFTIDGNTYLLAGKASYRVSSTENETLRGQDGVHGVKVMPQAGKISFTGRDSGAVKMQTLADVIDGTVVLSLVNGKTVIGRNMWRTGDVPEVDTEEGTFDVEFESNDVAEF